MTGIYKLINCNGHDYGIPKNEEILNRVIVILYPKNECTTNKKEIFIKKGDKFPKCFSCGNSASWKLKKSPISKSD